MITMRPLRQYRSCFMSGIDNINRGFRKLAGVNPPARSAARIVSAPNSQLGTIEARVRTLATELGSTVSGSYDPAVVGMPTGEFYDGDHLLEPGIQRLLAPIRQKLVTAPAL